MAFNLNDPGNTETTGQEQQSMAEVETVSFSTTDATQIADAKIKGLSETEIKNPEAIIVTVSDQQTPIVVLFGARTSGKTMMLIRLTKYLEGIGYNVVPDPIFRPDSDTHYQRMCGEFGMMAHSDYAAVGNDVMSFMLVKVISPTGHTVCQILEAPGEHYFDADIPNRDFPAYIKNIYNSISNRKTWVFIVEENWGGSQNVRTQYANKIRDMQQNIVHDRVIFACNKVDKSAHFRLDGRPNMPVIFQNIKNQYPQIFDRYVNLNPITRWFEPYKFDFIAFSAGSFNSTGDGRQVYTPGKDTYPEQLWRAIKKNI